MPDIMPDILNFTDVVIEAYESVGKMLGDPVVIYNKKEGAFGMTSSIFELGEDDVKIFTVREEMFEDYDKTLPLAENILLDEDLWLFVEISINYGGKK